LAAFDVQLCPMAWATGVPCPGCGLFRSLLALAQLDPVASFRFHPLGAFVGPILAMEALALAVPVVGRWRAGWTYSNATVVAAGLALVGVWAVRLAGGLGGHPDL
jgi:hypothetical protein